MANDITYNMVELGVTDGQGNINYIYPVTPSDAIPIKINTGSSTVDSAKSLQAVLDKIKIGAFSELSTNDNVPTTPDTNHKSIIANEYEVEKLRESNSGKFAEIDNNITTINNNINTLNSTVGFYDDLASYGDQNINLIDIDDAPLPAGGNLQVISSEDYIDLTNLFKYIHDKLKAERICRTRNHILTFDFPVKIIISGTIPSAGEHRVGVGIGIGYKDRGDENRIKLLTDLKHFSSSFPDIILSNIRETGVYEVNVKYVDYFMNNIASDLVDSFLSTSDRYQNPGIYFYGSFGDATSTATIDITVSNYNSPVISLKKAYSGIS